MATYYNYPEKVEQSTLKVNLFIEIFTLAVTGFLSPTITVQRLIHPLKELRNEFQKLLTISLVETPKSFLAMGSNCCGLPLK